MPTMSLNDWLEELDRVGREIGYHSGEPMLHEQTGRECWMNYYNDDYSPREALIEDLSNQ